MTSVFSNTQCGYAYSGADYFVLIARFAKISYARTKDAMDVCLLYVALGKKKVLSALAKLTQSESNQVTPA
jgi:hypothetical protein